MFREPQALNDVAAFHNLFDLPILNNPTIPAINRCELRINLLAEELDELKEAIADNDLVAVADALCDLQYVLSGAVLEFGLGEKFKALFDEVQSSNMSKACDSLEQAEATLSKYAQSGTEGYIVKKEDKFLVYRKSDHKVLKSIGYSEASLDQFIKS